MCYHVWLCSSIREIIDGNMCGFMLGGLCRLMEYSQCLYRGTQVQCKGDNQCFLSSNVYLQGCVKVWDISQPGNKSPISQLDCLVSWFELLTQ